MKNITEIVCVLDRSGSMESIVDDAIGGFNTFLKTQKESPGEAVMSVVLFDDQYELLHSGKPLPAISRLDRQTYVPRGSTALYDAIGKTIDDVGERLARLAESERPNKVLFVILTDGHENASHKYTSQQIHQLITHQRNVYSWEFLFLAANQDAFVVSQGLGISGGNSLNFQATSQGTHGMYHKLAKAAINYRAMDSDNMSRYNLLADQEEPQQEEPAKPSETKKKRVRKRI